MLHGPCDRVAVVKEINLAGGSQPDGSLAGKVVVQMLVLSQEFYYSISQVKIASLYLKIKKTLGIIFLLQKVWNGVAFIN